MSLLVPLLATLPLGAARLPWPQDPAPPAPAEPAPVAEPPAPAAPASGAAIALVGGTVHTMVPGEAPLEGATVLIRGERIEAVGRDLELAPGTERWDVAGLHLVPGLIDGAMSFDPAHDALYTATGVTVVRDLGGERIRLLLARRPEDRNRVPGPALLTAGQLIDGEPPSTPEAIVLRDAGAADALLPILFDERVDFLSTHLAIGKDPWQRTIKLAHDHGLEVWGPVPRAVGLEEAIRAGQDGILYLDRFVPAVVGVDWRNVQPAAFRPAIELAARAGTVVVPTLRATSLRLEDQAQDPRLAVLLRLLSPAYESWWLDELRMRHALWERDAAALELGQRIVEKQRGLLRALHEGGVRLLPGSVAPNPWLFPGQALHQELREWVLAGIPAAEALAAATSGAAEILGIADDFGTLQPGRYADVLCVAGNPDEDLAHLLEPRTIVLRGRPLDAAGIEDLYRSVETRETAAREALATPLAVDPPPTPEGAVVLEGLVETLALSQKVSAERFRVVRVPDGRIAYCGRILQSKGATDGTPLTGEVTVVQWTRDGQLDEFRLELRIGDSSLTCEGTWTAGRLQIHREADGVYLANQTVTERPVCLELGSVTTLLMLGQRELARPFPVLVFHESLEPELVNWIQELDDRGDHQVRTHLGRMAFRFEEHGAPSLSRVQVGTAVIETRLREVDTRGGPGLPLPASKRRAAPAPVEAGAGSGGTGSGENGGSAGGSAEGSAGGSDGGEAPSQDPAGDPAGGAAGGEGGGG